MQITDDLIDFLKIEYTEDKVKDFAYMGVQIERINSLYLSCIDEIIFICDIMSLSYIDRTKKYEPQIILANGKRSFSLDDIKDVDWIFLNKLLSEQIPIILKARISDLLWVCQMEYKSALCAIGYYIELYKLSFDSDEWLTCEYYINRALPISFLLGKKSSVYQDTCSFIREEIERINAEDPSSLTIKLIYDLYEVGYLKVRHFIPLVDKIIDRSSSDTYKKEKAFDLKLLIANGDDKLTCETHRDYAFFLEDYAAGILDNNYEDLFAKAQYLKRAASEFRKSHNRNDEKRLLLEIEKTESKLISCMPTINIPIESNNDDLEELLNIMDGMDFN